SPTYEPGKRLLFFRHLGLGEGAGAGADAIRTTSPLTVESAGLRITLSEGVTPWTISIVVPKSRPTLISWSSTLLSGFTTPTCNPCARNKRVLLGKVTIWPNEPEVSRACA